MKAIKRIMIVFAILGVLMEGFFLGLRYCVNKETDKVKTTHNSYVCEVSQTAGGYTYEIDGTVYSEADYVGYMEKASGDLGNMMIVFGVLTCTFILTATAAGKSAKKKEELAQPALC